jgi:hypothetical protein
MKAQTSTTPEINLNPTEQVTPVIVKIGGDMEGDAGPELNFLIDSQLMAFSDPNDPSSETWQTAVSNKTGRIYELTLNDGELKTVYCNVFPQPNALTSLQLTFPDGEHVDVFEVMEPGPVYRLQVQSSSKKFTILEPDPRGWKESEASFSSTSLTLTFKQTVDGLNDIFKFEYTFNSPQNAVFNLDFHADPGQ